MRRTSRVGAPAKPVLLARPAIDRAMAILYKNATAEIKGSVRTRQLPSKSGSVAYPIAASFASARREAAPVGFDGPMAQIRAMGHYRFREKKTCRPLRGAKIDIRIRRAATIQIQWLLSHNALFSCVRAPNSASPAHHQLRHRLRPIGTAPPERPGGANSAHARVPLQGAHRGEENRASK